jgi:16S rRNA (adenine1518-N6/adenine1519-N6)-dimethyltransferase
MNLTFLTGKLNEYGLRAEKRFGQNFLVDANILRKVVDAAELGGEETVLEVGPGLGVLTGELAKRAKNVIAVEIDKKLVAVLEKELAGFGNVLIKSGDIMKMDLREIIPLQSNIVANLPYNITTPFICSCLERELGLKKIVVMIQREAAERFTAQPGTKAYGAATLTAACYADVRIAAAVPPNCFYPQPDVVSAITVFDVLPVPRVAAENRVFVFKLIRAAFTTRRKTLLNCLSVLPYTKNETAEAIAKTGLDADIRGERLTLEQFEKLSRNLLNIKG